MQKVLSHMESKKNIRSPLSQVQIPLLESEKVARSGQTEEKIKRPVGLRRKKRRQYFAVRYSKNREQKLKEMRMRVKKVRLAALAAYGDSTCQCCYEKMYEFLALDHINNDGKKHRREVGGSGTPFYFWLKKLGFPKIGIQVLCHNCNTAKGLYGVCPHQFLKTPIDVFLKS
jgi:hypothetical protein